MGFLLKAVQNDQISTWGTVEDKEGDQILRMGDSV